MKGRILISKTFKSISKTFKFECSHRLTLNYESPCQSLHGHSYTVKVIIKTDQLNENGMVIDFKELKRFQRYLDDNFDHATLINKNDTDLLEFVKNQNQKYLILENNTTSENIAELLCDEFIKMFNDEINIHEITVNVWETQNNEASYTVIPVIRQE